MVSRDCKIFVAHTSPVVHNLLHAVIFVGGYIFPFHVAHETVNELTHERMVVFRIPISIRSKSLVNDDQRAMELPVSDA